MLNSEMETSTRMIFLYFVIIISAAEEVKENLTAVVGGNITLPDALMERGFLSFGTTNIASVNKNEFQIEEEFYTDKLYWNKKTGRFTIKNLQKNDSGVYSIDSKKGNIFQSSYHLTVYDSAPSPAVRRLKVNSVICLLECFVDEKTKLSWYKDEQILNQSSSDLSLLLTVDKQDFSSSFRCVSANPAENKTLLVNIKEFCREENKAGSLDDTNRRHYLIFAVTVVSIMFVLVIVLIAWRTKPESSGRKQDGENRRTEALFAVIQERGEGGNFPASSGSVDRSCLTIVHYKPVRTQTS